MEEKEKSSRGSGEQKNSSGDKEGKTADRDIVKMKKALRLQKFLIGALAVSYTHLDVYKRQVYERMAWRQVS